MIFAFFNNPSAGASKYILRDLIDAPMPDSIAWWPQTIGWQVLFALLALYICVKLIKKIRLWWHNRYRQEAVNALQQINADDQEKALLQFHKIIQITARYAYPAITSDELCGSSLIEWLNKTKECEINENLGLKWQQALLQPNVMKQVTPQEVVELQQKLITWVYKHPILFASNKDGVEDV